MTILTHKRQIGNLELEFQVNYRGPGDWDLSMVSGASPNGVILPSIEKCEEMALEIDWDLEYRWVMEDYLAEGRAAI